MQLKSDDIWQCFVMELISEGYWRERLHSSPNSLPAVAASPLERVLHPGGGGVASWSDPLGKSTIHLFPCPVVNVCSFAGFTPIYTSDFAKRNADKNWEGGQDVSSTTAADTHFPRLNMLPFLSQSPPCFFHSVPHANLPALGCLWSLLVWGCKLPMAAAQLHRKACHLSQPP